MAFHAVRAIGGEAKVRAVLQALYDRLFVDPMVGFLFEGKDKAHIVEQQLAFTCRFLGGPQVYEGMPLPGGARRAAALARALRPPPPPPRAGPRRVRRARGT